MTDRDLLELIAQKVSKMDGDIIGIKNEITGMKDKITGMEREISGIKSEITGMKGEISGIKDEIFGMKSEIKELKQSQAYAIQTRPGGGADGRINRIQDRSDFPF